MMRSVLVHKFGGPKVLQVEKVHIPALLSNTFRVKVKYAGLNPVDTYIREGKYERLPSLPYTPGRDFSGTIDAVSPQLEGHEKFQLGRRVYGMLLNTMGTYSEYCFVNPSVDAVEVLPDHVDFAAGAAATTTYITAYRALFQKAACKSDDIVLVHGGSGGVGTAAIEMARHKGATVLATAGTDKGLQIVKSSGASHAFNHTTEGYENQILECTQGAGVDIIVENAGHVNLQKDLRLLKRNGTVAIVGCRGPIEVNPRECMAKESTIQGILVHNMSKNELEEAMVYIQAGLASKVFNPIYQNFDMEEISRAHEELMKPCGGGACGRVLLKIS